MKRNFETVFFIDKIKKKNTFLKFSLPAFFESTISFIEYWKL